MDNFMDKIAQKLAAQEAIRANAAADTAQMEKLEAQVAEYDACMKEMRKLNLKNAENEQKLNELLKEGSEQFKDCIDRYGSQLEGLMKENDAQIRKLTEECILKVQGTQSEKEETDELKQLLVQMQETASANREKMEELFKNSDEFVHKENVKVYRNVQAAVVEELGKQTEAFSAGRKEMMGRHKGMFIMNIVTLVAVIANLAILIAHLAGLL